MGRESTSIMIATPDPCLTVVKNDNQVLCFTLSFSSGMCMKGNTMLHAGETRDFSITSRRRRNKPAADVVFVTDESKSMITEHAWLTQLSENLDKSLVEQGIGGDVPNLFGLVGFAKNSPEDVTGRSIRMENGRLFGSAKELSDSTKKLAINGRQEDLYLGILKALDDYPFRPGMACQIVGVTDEGRTPLMPPANSTLTSPATKEYVLKRLKEKKCVLNVVVNQQMLAGEEAALGVGSSLDAFVERANGSFEVFHGQGEVVEDSGHGSTHNDYTLLAFESGGGAWDLNRLRDAGNTAASFTKAFVWLKEREITRQLCERCTCIEGHLEPVCRLGCFGE